MTAIGQASVTDGLRYRHRARPKDSGVGFAPPRPYVPLHAPDDLLRNRLVPLNRVYPVSTLIEAAGQYAETTGRRVTFEYALIRRVNDSDECARSLARLIKGMLCHVNLIPLNPVSGIALERSDRVQAFHDLLQNEGIDVTIRRELGIDIDAACGQLRRRHAEP